MNREARKRELVKITKENQMILKRLKQVGVEVAAGDVVATASTSASKPM